MHSSPFSLAAHVMVSVIVLWFLLIPFRFVSAQSASNAGEAKIYSGAVSVTTKGISTVPNLTLGKPAAQFDVRVGRRKLTFEPEFRFALEGKPWSFIFRWRYQLVSNEKFQLRIGAQPVLSFITSPVVRNGLEEDVIEARRFLAGEVTSSYSLTRHLRLGVYYLRSHGFEKSTFRNMNYVSFSTGLTNIELPNNLTVTLTPQVYYLKIDEDDGVYFSFSSVVAKRDFPVSVSALVNRIIKTDIFQKDVFLWNVTLIYSY